MKYLKVKLVLVLVFYVSIDVNSQSYFNKLQDSTGTTYGQVAQYDDHYYIRGTGRNLSGTGSLVFVKTNLNGNIHKVDTFSLDSVVTVGGIFEILDDKLYLFNTVNDTRINGFPPDASKYDLQFSVLDLEFNVEKTITWGSSGGDISRDMLMTEDGFLLLAVSSGFSGRSEFYLTKVNFEGEIQWEKTYGGATRYLPWSINYTHDGNFILSGSKEIASPNWNIYMVKITPDGDVIWEKDYGTDENNFGGRLINTFDNSFLVYRNIQNSSTGNIVAYLDKLDSDGLFIWSKSFSISDRSAFEFSKPIENPDGTITVVNNIFNENERRIDRLIKLDPFGNTLWSKEFYTNPDKHQYIYDIQPLEDGGYIMAGSAFPLHDNSQHGWLVRTNCRGEEDEMYPVESEPCEEYDCTSFSVDATFTADRVFIDLAYDSVITFTNETGNTTARTWDFGDGTKGYTSGEIPHTYTEEGVYEVSLINFHTHCTDTAWLTVEVISTVGLSLHDKLAQQIKLFPNPNNGSFTIENNTQKTVEIVIIDALGKKIHHQNSSTTQENITLDLPKGVYSVSFMQDSNVVMKKMVVR